MAALKALAISYKCKPIEAPRRQNVLRLAAEGATRARIAAELKLGEATVYRILASQKLVSQ